MRYLVGHSKRQRLSNAPNESSSVGGADESSKIDSTLGDNAASGIRLVWKEAGCRKAISRDGPDQRQFVN